MQYLAQLILCIALAMPHPGEAAVVAVKTIKDPMAYPLSQYGFIFLISLLGGVASWYSKVRKGEVLATNLSNLVGELTTSALAGLLAFYTCEWLDVAPVLTAAIVGVAGHMGTRGISMAEEVLQGWIEKRTGS